MVLHAHLSPLQVRRIVRKVIEKIIKKRQVLSAGMYIKFRLLQFVVIT